MTTDEVEKLRVALNKHENLPRLAFRRNAPIYELVCYANNLLGCYLSGNWMDTCLFIDRCSTFMLRHPETAESRDYCALLRRYVAAITAFDTERLHLRLAESGDRDDLIVLEQDPEVMRFLNGGESTPKEGRPGDFLMPRGNEPDVWVAIEKSTGAFIGWFILHATEPGVAELGYRLRHECWGRGLATEGCRALMVKGFDEFGLERIVGSTMAVNIRSRRVMERLGMRLFRTVHGNWTVPLPGSEQGDVDYEITRQEWQKRPPAAI